nr:CMGC/CDK protein kinase [Kwoniella bestiolae CBS 10118]OCF22807.1 CMGC/CDK protein kinase [Kwoniella bestiolae CBS 10118]
MIPISQCRQGDIYAVPLNHETDVDSHEARAPGHGQSDEIEKAVNDHGGIGGWKVLKRVYAPLDGYVRGREPHNIVHEVDMLRKVDHRHIVNLLSYEYDEQTVQHTLSLPLYPISLSELFQDPSFPFPSSSSELDNPVPKIISYQLLCGVSYLHSLIPPIAHRDLNPSNVMFDAHGNVRIIDFGIAYTSVQARSFQGYSQGEQEGWKENDGVMCCDVGTGSYRAPELLFSPSTYDPTKIDLWAVGCIIAQLFRPFSFGSDSSDSVSSSSSSCSHSSSDPLEEEDPLDSRLNMTGTGSRKPLFDSAYGSLGLGASIFRVMGRPSMDNWPEFTLLPDSNKMDFPPSSPTPLDDHLPLLAYLSEEGRRGVLHVIGGLLRLDPSRRVGASEILNMDWFADLNRADVGENVGFKTFLDGAIEKYSILEKSYEEDSGRIW